ncbi:hypothetical protein PRIPAC_79013 [Pristionchus pacificus]|uniref:Uncharacterized protein n=1 Tax=Pristionchus pacificus TaxID=54126 RepID=A0A2A6CN26_PRIPA|nr:hypothetical protein PRIPAC_79013 [Pristionchus pacificus]|eukprot:PDM79500.1 hypothetical protein PRIPAC_32079 [Pristionchus pacificus]
MPSALAVFDYCQTVGVSIALVATIPPAGFVYFKVIFSRKFSARYIFKLIAINGIAFYRILSYVIRVVVSLATFLLNVILCVFVTRERRNIRVTQKKRFNAEKGLVITGVLAYATYMISFVNNLIARYFNVLFCGYAQWIFLGIKSIAPFWCLIAFTPSVRRLFVSRKQASSTTPVKSITLTA